MKILALDSTAKAGSAAVLDGERLLSLFLTDCGNTHSESLLPMALDALRVSGTSIDDVGLFAVSAGPGSFTGVRIGAAVIKGLAFGRDVPCVAVSALEALAENARGMSGLIVPVMDARRAQVYTAIFESDGDIVTRVLDDSALAISELAQKLATRSGKVWLVGDGVGVTLPALLAAGIDASAAPELCVRANAASVAKVALREYEKGNYVSDTTLAPTYLRLPQAERERMEKNNGKQ